MPNLEVIDYLKTCIKPNVLGRMIVAFDGIDAAGKTCFATDFLNSLLEDNLNVVLVSVDNFHNPKKIRYEKGVNSAEGFYLDSYNYQALIEKTILPFKNYEDKICVQSFNLANDCEEFSFVEIEGNTILILEGIFLQRKELRHLLDFTIFLEVSFDTALKRNIARAMTSNLELNINEIVEKYNARYMQGQQLYFNSDRPEAAAEVIIDNNNYELPIIKKYFKML